MDKAAPFFVSCFIVAISGSRKESASAFRWIRPPFFMLFFRDHSCLPKITSPLSVASPLSDRCRFATLPKCKRKRTGFTACLLRRDPPTSSPFTPPGNKSRSWGRRLHTSFRGASEPRFPLSWCTMWGPWIAALSRHEGTRRTGCT